MMTYDVDHHPTGGFQGIFFFTKYSAKSIIEVQFVLFFIMSLSIII